MVRLPLVFFAAGILLPFAVNSSAIGRKSFIELAKRETDEEICGVANHYLCSDRLPRTCCPYGYLCISGELDCIKDPDNPNNDPTQTDNVPLFTVTASPKKPVLSTGAIAGIAVGGVILLIAIGVALFFCIRKRKIGKEVLKAYEDPNRNMYDQVVVEGKRISVVPVAGGSTQQRRQTQTQLSPPTETQEFDIVESAQDKPEQYQQQQQQQQQQPQQYQAYQPQPQQIFYNTHGQGQDTEYTATDQTYQSPQNDPVPEALRVGSPVSPIRADSMGMIPVGNDSPTQSQHPYQFSPVQGMVRHHSTPLSPAPHHSPSPPPLPQSTSLPTMPTHSPSPPPLPQSPVYHETPPPQAYIQQSPGGYQPQQGYGQQQQLPPQDPYTVSSPPDQYSHHTQYQQYPPASPPPQTISSPVSPISGPPINPSRHSSQPQGHEIRRTGDYSDWGRF